MNTKQTLTEAEAHFLRFADETETREFYARKSAVTDSGKVMQTPNDPNIMSAADYNRESHEDDLRQEEASRKTAAVTDSGKAPSIRVGSRVKCNKGFAWAYTVRFDTPTAPATHWTPCETLAAGADCYDLI